MSRQIRVKVNASSKTEGVRRLADDYYQVRTRAPAERGKANLRVAELLAAEFGCEPRSVRIVAGVSSPLKLVEIG